MPSHPGAMPSMNVHVEDEEDKSTSSSSENSSASSSDSEETEEDERSRKLIELQEKVSVIITRSDEVYLTIMISIFRAIDSKNCLLLL